MSAKKQNIVLIGSGNVATQMGLALKKAGHNILQVYSRTQSSRRALAIKLRSQPVNNLKKIASTADIYIIAIKDDAVNSIAKQLKVNDKLIAHTSGSLPSKILKSVSSNYGVLYPLQTLSKNKIIDFSSVPLCIEANTKVNEKKLLALAGSVSKHVHLIDSEKRKIVHLAAVFACNFTNHMYTLAEKLLRKNKLSFELLLPLIHETADKIKQASPSKMQTGPAIRNDKSTMKAHIILLSKQKRMKKIYKLMSQSIMKNKL